MKSNTTKTRTIASFFSPPSPSKRRKLNDPLPTTGASPRLIHSPPPIDPLPTTGASPRSIHSPAPIDPLPTTGASPRSIRSPAPIDPLPTTGASPRSIRSPAPIDPLPTTGASPRSIHSPAPIDASSRLVSSPPETDAFPRPMISPLSNSVSSQLLLSPSSSLVFPTDISRSSADPPSRPVLSSYKTGSDNRSFQKHGSQVYHGLSTPSRKISRIAITADISARRIFFSIGIKVIHSLLVSIVGKELWQRRKVSINTKRAWRTLPRLLITTNFSCVRNWISLQWMSSRREERNRFGKTATV